MRLKELHIRNIASIESGDINFETGLNDIDGKPAPLFIINGDTGSGKTVILDCITLALFKTTPRLGSVANMRGNRYDNGTGNTMSVTDLEQYTRLGISSKDECYAELTFYGNDCSLYTSRLSLGINRNGNYRTAEWKVKKDNEDWQTKDNIVRPIILEAIGTSYDQFCRLAMLAQGQFAAFLTGKKDEREKILEQLTNTQIFTQYGNAIHEIFKVRKNDKDTKQALLTQAQTNTLKEEEVEKYKNDINTLILQSARKQKEINKANSDIHALKELNAALDKISTTQTHLAENQEKQKSPEHMHDLEMVNGWDSTTPQREALKESEKARTTITDAESKIEQEQTKFMALLSDLAQRRLNLVNLKTKATDCQNFLDQEKSNADIYDQAGATIEKINQFLHTGIEIDKTNKSLGDENSKTQNLTSNDAKAQRALKDGEEKVKDKQATITRTIEKRDALNPDQVDKDFKAESLRHRNLLDLLNVIETKEESSKKARQLQADIDNQESALKGLNKAYIDAKTEKEKAANALIIASQIRQDLQTSNENYLMTLRRHLIDHKADACPLCGQKIDLDILQRDFKELIAPREKAEEEAKKTNDAAQQLFNQAQKNLTQAQAAISTNQKLLRELNGEIAIQQGAIEAKSHELNLQPSQLQPSELHKMIDRAMQQVSDLEAAQAQISALQKAIDKMLNEKAALEKVQKALQKTSDEANKLLQANLNNISNLNEKLSQLQTAKTSQSQEIANRISTLFPDWSDNPSSAIESLTQKTQEYNRQVKQLETYNTSILLHERLISTLNQTLAAINRLQPSWPHNSGTCQELSGVNDNQIQERWTRVVSQLTAFEKTINDAQTILGKSENLLEEFFKSSPFTRQSLTLLIQQEGSIALARKRINDLNQEHQSLSDALKDAQQAQQAARQALQLIPDQEIPELSQLQNQVDSLTCELSRINEEKGAKENLLSNNNANVDKVTRLEKDLAQATESFNKWWAIDQVFGGSRFRTLVQTHILRPLLNNANIYLRQITDHYELTCCEQNEQLSILVKDLYCRGQVRSVTVLSGGERFMLSLALSLALSTINRPDLMVDILFIDEGFGTLDQKSLDSVVSTLEKLQEIAGQQNRRVGIISHREELTERFPVRIEVKKRGEGRSAISITAPN